MFRPANDLIEVAGPVASPFGILSPAVTLVEDYSDNWVERFTYETPDAGVSAVNRFIAGGDLAVTDTVTARDTNAELFRLYRPFDIETTFNTSTFGVTVDWIEDQSRKALEVVTQKAVEHEYWTGALSKQLTDANTNRYLASTDTIDVTPTAGTGLRVRHAQALLEQALGDATIGSAGVLHAPRAVASVMHLGRDGHALVTKLGNSVVAGTGYMRTGPDGTAATGQNYWMYATGPVTVLLGKPMVRPGTKSQAVDIRQNSVEWYANRPAAVVSSTAHIYAVLVDLSLDFI